MTTTNEDEEEFSSPIEQQRDLVNRLEEEVQAFVVISLEDQIEFQKLYARLEEERHELHEMEEAEREATQ